MTHTMQRLGILLLLGLLLGLMVPAGMALAETGDEGVADTVAEATEKEVEADEGDIESDKTEEATDESTDEAGKTAELPDKTRDEASTETVMSALSVTEPIFPPLEAVKHGNVTMPNVNAATGALSYAYPLMLPPGRNGMQPALALEYNSNSSDSANLVGYGWNLSLPKIERLARHGADDLYNFDDFSSSLSGELVSISSSTYAARTDDGSALTYSYNADHSWTVTDKAGRQYLFGTTDTARMVNPDDATQIAAWYLTSISDANNNTVNFFYEKDGGQVYPSRIEYSDAFAVAFAREARADVQTSFATGFAVTTAQRISSITTTVNDLPVRSFTLSYTVGDNGIRSVLADVTETAHDEDGGPSMTLPTTSFAYSESARTWTEVPGFTFPVSLSCVCAANLGTEIVDVNGDALPDVVRSRDTTREVYLNTGNNTWELAPAWTVPISFSSAAGWSQGVQLADVNGDGLTDLLSARMPSSGPYDPATSAVYINTGAGWELDTAWTVPIALSGNYDRGVRIFDADGDSLPDLVYARRETADLTVTSAVYVNTGSGWELDLGYTVPVAFTDTSLSESGVRTVDVNNDNLIDLVHSQSTTSGLVEEVYINQGNGTGWLEDTAFTVPDGFINSIRRDRGMRAQDVNGDGLTDLLLARNSSTVLSELYINRGDGTGWVEDPEFSAPFVFTGDAGLDFGVRSIDVNGDMVEDALISRNVSSDLTRQLFLGDGERADLLQEIHTPHGGSLNIAYGSIVAEHSDLWFPVQVVESITMHDGLDSSTATNYSYADGFYSRTDAWDRKFAGFGLVTTTDALGNTTQEYFHQGNSSNSAQGEFEDHVSKIGRRYRQERRDAAGNLFATVIDRWERTAIDATHDRVMQTQSLSLEYDGNADHRDQASSWVIDPASGNVTTTTSWGEVTGADDGTFTDMAADAVTTTLAYANWPSGNASSLVAQETLSDITGTRLRENQTFYDGLPAGAVVTGNVTSDARWISGSTYATMAASYDAYGFLTSLTDALGHTTTLTPNSTHTAPASITNPLGQTVSFLYDDSSGGVREMTDVNGHRFVRDLDARDREIARWQPDITNPSTLVMASATIYNDASVPLSATRTDYASDTAVRATTTMFDGWLRPIQVKTAHDATTWRTLDTTYDAVGQVATSALPYATTTASFTPRTTDATLLTTFSYDALGRVTSAHHSLGTSSVSYDQWRETSTDENGHIKGSIHDAFDRLVAVEEYPGVTSYTWNGRGDLTGLTDALGNIRNFTFDGLSRRTRAEDLHAPSDRSFGVWTFMYDAAGNMTRQTNPKAQITNFTYDALNRVLTEDFTGTSGIEVTSTYDTCANGLGKLCRVAMPAAVGATTAYQYNVLGQVTQEAKTIASTTYTTTTSTDRQGNPLEIVLPDTSRYGYTYDTVSNLTSITYRDVPTSSVPAPVFSPVISDVTYALTGTPAAWTAANGLRTERTFDPAQEYRLTRIQAGTLEDLAYSYDAKGNITTIVDASATDRAKTTTYTYDALDRLTAASVSAPANGDDTSWTWSYNAIGNLLTQADTTTDTTQTYLYRGNTGTNYANPQAATTIGTATQTYDRNGNLTADGTQTYAWNYQNRLTKLVRGTTATSYYYDHTGSRIKVRRGSITTVYPNMFYNIQGNVRTKHVYLGDIPVATITTQGSSTLTTTKRYLLTDHLNSTVASTTATGAVDELLDYHPYGTPRITVTASAQEQRTYAGHEGDRPEGLSYMQARYYNPSQGRFITQDPLFVRFASATDEREQLLLLDPQLQNAYVYARGNPVVLRDPDGELTNRTYWQKFSSIHLRVDYACGIYLADKLFSIFPITAGFLHYSLTLEPQRAYIRERNQAKWGNVIDAIKESSSFKNKINELIGAQMSSGKTTIETPVGYRLDSTQDLAMALGTVTMFVNGSQREDGTWDLTITIFDKYHFEDSYDYGDPVSNAMNDQAAQAQDEGLISAFRVDIQFDYNYSPYTACTDA